MKANFLQNKSVQAHAYFINTVACVYIATLSICILTKITNPPIVSITALPDAHNHNIECSKSIDVMSCDKYCSIINNNNSNIHTYLVLFANGINFDFIDFLLSKPLIDIHAYTCVALNTYLCMHVYMRVCV